MTDLRDKIAEVLTETCMSSSKADIIADAILAAIVDGVPDLVWEELSPRHYRTPAPLFGNIRIESYGDGEWLVMWSAPGITDALIPQTFKTLEEAKAAANALHRAAVLKAMGIEG